MVKGIGKFQLEQKEKSTMSIFKVLSDGKQHRYKEIKEKTRLNDPTLQKYFKQFLNMNLIEKEVDIKSGKYPYPSYYKATSGSLIILQIDQKLKIQIEQIEKIISDPECTILTALYKIDMIINNNILGYLEIYKRKDLNSETQNFISEMFIVYTYKILTGYFIETSKKIIENINIKEFKEKNARTLFIDKYEFKNILEELLIKSSLTENEKNNHITALNKLLESS